MRLSREPLPLAVVLVVVVWVVVVLVKRTTDQQLPGENSVRLIRRSTNENPALLSLLPLLSSMLSLRVNLQYKHVILPCPIWFVYPPAISDLVCLSSGYVRSGLFSPASTPSPYSPRVDAIYSRFGLYLKVFHP